MNVIYLSYWIFLVIHIILHGKFYIKLSTIEQVAYKSMSLIEQPDSIIALES